MIFNNYHIVYFDGECILCNYFYKKLLKWDKSQVFHFATLQNEKSKEYLSQFPNYSEEIDSIIYTYNGKMYIQDQAVFAIAKNLPFPFSNWSPKL